MEPLSFLSLFLYCCLKALYLQQNVYVSNFVRLKIIRLMLFGVFVTILFIKKTLVYD